MAIQTTTPTAIKFTNEPLPKQFKRADSTIKHRMTLSIEGDFGGGKTDLALTAPGPIAFFRFDLNCDVPIAKWAKEKEIYMLEYESLDPEDDKIKQVAEVQYKAFIRDYVTALANRHIRTIIWDTATEIWELVRLATFGKLVGVLPHAYVLPNAGFRRLMNLALESDTNLIMVHRLKDEWAKDKSGKDTKTGQKERAGFTDLGSVCQIMVRTWLDEKNQFSMQVLKCTQNYRLTNQIYTQAGDLRMNSFPVLAADVFNTSFEEWQ